MFDRWFLAGAAPAVEAALASIPPARGGASAVIEPGPPAAALAKHGGTVLLDEIGNLPLELQPKLLRALEGREIRRVGGQQSRKVDIRLVGATHIDLGAAVARGEFREDLFYRLNVVALVLPPLRERGEDVEVLAEAFAARLAAQYGLPTPALGPEVREAIRAHHWPGNIRELRNAIERGLVLSAPGTLELSELSAGSVTEPPPSGAIPFPATIRQKPDAMHWIRPDN